MARAGRPLLPQEVLQATLHAVPGLGIATVDRHREVPVADHDLTLYGRCDDCVGSADRSARHRASAAGSHLRTGAHAHRHRG